MIKRIVRGIFHRLGYQIVRVDEKEEVKLNSTIIRGKQIIGNISKELKVLNGVFEGLQYPSLDITEAALVPKIIGSYESQLHNVIEEVIQKQYSNIIDIGSAEGYYAVGLASKMPNTKVHAFDINEKDLLFCQKMAQLNDVENLTFNNFCNAETLIHFNFGNKGFVFCDCEGYELELFTPKVVQNLKDKKVDVLVELHDICSPEISSTLISRFVHTHDFQIINTNMASKINWKGLENLSEEDKKFALLEHRGGIDKSIYMEWAYFTVR